MAKRGQKQHDEEYRFRSIARLSKRRRNRAWSDEETNALLHGVTEYGEGKWKLILTLFHDKFIRRTEVDLKDKWRNLLRYHKSKKNQMLFRECSFMKCFFFCKQCYSLNEKVV